MQEILTPTREFINGVYYCIHVSADGKTRVNTGPDDQRPDHDGERFFRPICVQETVNGSCYTYTDYCGKCRRRIGGLGETKQFCPRCGAGIAHYKFSMGYEKFELWPKSGNRSAPDVWHTIIDAEETQCQLQQNNSSNSMPLEAKSLLNS